jgi:TRAP-type uncharacterized transport system fused permease subunit
MAPTPTLLYYLWIFLMIEGDSRRAGARPRNVLAPALLPLTPRSGYHFSSLFAIVTLMALGMTPFAAVVWAILLAVGLSFLQRETALRPRRLL